MYSLDDLEAAKIALAALQEKFDRYTGNNPDKYRAEIEAAKLRLHTVESALKSAGLLPLTAIEERDAQLDNAFPNARSKQVVLWEGRKYIRRFAPASQSLSGKTVYAWHKYWEELAD